MAAAAAAAAARYCPGSTLGQVVEPLAQNTRHLKHDVVAELNYYKDPGDGTLPAPYYVG